MSSIISRLDRTELCGHASPISVSCLAVSLYFQLLSVRLVKSSLSEPSFVISLNAWDLSSVRSILRAGPGADGADA